MSEEYKYLPPYHASFEIALDANPQNWSLRLTYSRHLASIGEFDQARCQKWMAENKQCPRFFQEQWHFGSGIDSSSHDSEWVGHRVPQALNYDRRSQASWLGYETRRGVEIALAHDMAERKVEVELAQMKIPPDEDW